MLQYAVVLSSNFTPHNSKQPHVRVASTGPLSVSLSGDITIYDPAKTDAPIKSVLVGHQAPLSALAYDLERQVACADLWHNDADLCSCYDNACVTTDNSDTLATGCRDGLICTWKDGIARRYSGKCIRVGAW